MAKTLYVHVVMHVQRDRNEFEDLDVFSCFFENFAGSMRGRGDLALEDGSEALIVTFTYAQANVRTFQQGAMTAEDVADRKAAAVELLGNDACFRGGDASTSLLLILTPLIGNWVDEMEEVDKACSGVCEYRASDMRPLEITMRVVDIDEATAFLTLLLDIIRVNKEGTLDMATELADQLLRSRLVAHGIFAAEVDKKMQLCLTDAKGQHDAASETQVHGADAGRVLDKTDLEDIASLLRRERVELQ